MTVAMAAMGVCSILYGLSTQIGVAILIVTISGFANAPSAIARSTLLQRTTPRDMGASYGAASTVRWHWRGDEWSGWIRCGSEGARDNAG